MKIKKNILIVIAILLLAGVVNAQLKVGKTPTALANGALLDVHADNDVRFYIQKSNGLVGIGNTTPTATLTVGKSDGSVQGQVWINPRTADAGGALWLAASTGHAAQFWTLDQYGMGIPSNQNRFRIFPGADETKGIAITDDGNVGVGTNVPSTTLTVGSADGLRPGLVWVNPRNTTDQGGGIVVAGSLSPVANAWIIDQFGGGTSTNPSRFRIFPTSGELNGIAMLQNGNLGLGTHVPQRHFHMVTGDMLVSPLIGQTGAIFNGLSNMNAVEISDKGYISAQRSEAAGLHLTKAAGYISPTLASFWNNGISVGVIELNAGGTGVNYSTTSDIRLKTNIQPLEKSMDILNGINVYSYNYKIDETSTKQYGVLAQELYKVFPYAVTKGGDNAKEKPWMVDYSKMIPVLIGAVKEQQKLIEEQQEQIEKLSQKMGISKQNK